MWDDAGIVRDRAGLTRADLALRDMAAQFAAVAAPGGAQRAFNLAWHDWLNLDNLVEVSLAIVQAAQSRENSRGAHYRRDFPDQGDLATSAYTRVRRQDDGAFSVEHIPVRFTRVVPGAKS
jgi:fumarate reductase flavoprotein subunit